ncbi:polyprenyl synthetase family protein [Caviibacter abscessus]|uniref:polyprenyl synthetase family protein n=1 Tax=Caviibacter abscessus TaxID=1766719 RepID=UPI00082FEBB7|nr:farnesyl diphosphate synthase [Caviibacter abscessus]
MKKYIEDNLKKALLYYKRNTDLYHAMCYSVLNGGKRIRPMLCLHMADIFNASYDRVIDIAIAIEFIHSYSLVHDDLPGMDNDTYRRGELTTHAKYGQALGILAGDALLTEAFSIIARSKLKHKVEIIEKLTYYAGVNGMIYGQELDIKYENHKINLDTLNIIHKNKTGALLKACIELVLMELEIENEQKLKFIDMINNLGLAYQIQDDIIDVIGNFEDSGKEKSDDRNNKSTYVSILGLNKSLDILDNIFESIKNVSKDYPNLDKFIDTIIKRKG